MGKAVTSSTKRARVEADKQWMSKGSGSTQKRNKSAMTNLGELMGGFDEADENNTASASNVLAEVDLEYHNRLVEQSKHFKSDNQFKELLRLRFKLIANGVLKPKNSLDNLKMPKSVLEKVGELFECLEWALSAEEE